MTVDAHNHLLLSHADWGGAPPRALPVDEIVERLREGVVVATGLIVGGDRAFPDREASPWNGTIGALAQFWRGVAPPRERGFPILSADDIDRVSIETPGFLLGLEGAGPLFDNPLGDPIAAMHLLIRLGVRSLQLLGGEPRSVFDRDPLRLSSTGREIISEAGRLGVLIDLSHLTGDEPAFGEILQAAASAPIASHHACRVLNANDGSLSDDSIRALANAGGVVAIHCGSQWLSDEARQGRVNDVVAHVRHVVDLVGADHVGVGSDHVDIRALPRELPDNLFVAGFDGPESFGMIAEALTDAGFDSAECRKILGENVLRVWRGALSRDEVGPR